MTEARKASIRKYAQSEKGKAKKQEYAKSHAHKESKRKYDLSEHGRRKKKEYSLSERGKKLNKNRLLKYRFGIDSAIYDSMFQEQNGLCRCCKKQEKLCVDHEHDTGKIRGLVCKKCNTAIGLLGDNEAGVQNALNYLKRRE